MSYILSEFDANMKKIIDTGYSMMDRTGTGCKYLSGIRTEIDISERVPVPTKRKTAWKKMLAEYLWFITGSSNINDLRDMGSKVWDYWEDKSFTDKQGFDEGSIGFGYGQNLIHAGSDIIGVGGVNQIDYVINELKTNPFSRRILIDFWRADKLDQVKLCPCHMVYQWIVVPDVNGNPAKLDCVVYQRSSDVFVGNLSTNLQGAAFYTYMIAQQVGLSPNKLIHISGHAHVYDNHIVLAREYLARPDVNSPILHLTKRESIYDYTVDDFVLNDYTPLASMKVPVSI